MALCIIAHWKRIKKLPTKAGAFLHRDRGPVRDVVEWQAKEHGKCCSSTWNDYWNPDVLRPLARRLLEGDVELQEVATLTVTTYCIAHSPNIFRPEGIRQAAFSCGSCKPTRLRRGAGARRWTEGHDPTCKLAKCQRKDLWRSLGQPRGERLSWVYSRCQPCFRLQTLWRSVTTNVAGRPVAFQKMGCSGKSPKDTILAATRAPQLGIHGIHLSADIYTHNVME